MDPAICEWFLYLFLVRTLGERDGSSYPQTLQVTVQLPQRILRIVPASTLIYRNVNIVCTEILHQLENRSVPIASEYLLIIPMDAGYE